MVSAMEIYMLLPKTNCKKCGASYLHGFCSGLIGQGEEGG